MFFYIQLTGDYMDIINKIIWSTAISFILINSVYYSIKLKFPQFRINKILKSIITNKKTNNISPTDTLIMSLSSKIGVGSLAGTGISLYYGGLGTIFWMWISTFFLSIITYLENSLSIIYKEKDGNLTKSGPPYYIKKGIHNKKLSIIYAIGIIVTYIVLFSSIQNNTITTLLNNTLQTNKVLISIIITIMIIPTVIKGIKFISKVCNKLFPLMMIIYITIGIIITIKNLNTIPLLFSDIVKNAFSTNSISGGIIYIIIISLQKTIFANESGVGTSAIISGTTSNNDYHLQGNIGIVQTYFINFVILTITAIIIGTTDYSNLTIMNGIELTKYAFNYHLGITGDIILIIILFLFSFSTIITIYYYGENNLKFLTKNKKIVNLLKMVYILSIFIGGIINANIIWNMINIMLAILTIINMYSIYKIRNQLIQKLTKK